LSFSVGSAKAVLEVAKVAANGPAGDCEERFDTWGVHPVSAVTWGRIVAGARCGPATGAVTVAGSAAGFAGPVCVPMRVDWSRPGRRAASRTDGRGGDEALARGQVPGCGSPSPPRLDPEEGPKSRDLGHVRPGSRGECCCGGVVCAGLLPGCKGACGPDLRDRRPPFGAVHEPAGAPGRSASLLIGAPGSAGTAVRGSPVGENTFFVGWRRGGDAGGRSGPRGDGEEPGITHGNDLWGDSWCVVSKHRNWPAGFAGATTFVHSNGGDGGAARPCYDRVTVGPAGARLPPRPANRVRPRGASRDRRNRELHVDTLRGRRTT